jgi:hypothetical protein
MFGTPCWCKGASYEKPIYQKTGVPMLADAGSFI